ncbi:MAG: rhomboid family intramembrane serine protease [Simkaniaceae bacterium]|nr:rhomboid family intramembrane serine protease [Simkaniaceae bacterium]
MRLVATFEERDQARRYYYHLSSEGVHALFELDGEKYQVWVYKEEDIDKAKTILEEFNKAPHDSKFDIADDAQIAQPTEPVEISEDPVFLARMQEMRQKLSAKPLYSHIVASFTKGIIFLCVILFALSGWQRYQLAKDLPDQKEPVALFTPIENYLLFNRPVPINVELEMEPKEQEALIEEAKQQHIWVGFYYILLNWPASKGAFSAPLFTDILHGQVWRLFTPIILHGGFLHILFNMMWVWLLGKQIEERLGKWRYVLMILIIALVSNVAQYLMVGPAFLGFSGVICGFAGFIWIRQKVAPWEGYPLQKGAALFLAIFVLGIAALQLVSFLLKIMNVADFPIQIANTAHFMGAIVGILLAKTNLFARKKHESGASH